MPDFGPGPRMVTILAYVKANPGCSKSDAARCGSEGPLYSSSVEALVRRGLVRAEQTHPGSRYRLYASDPAVTEPPPASRGPGLEL